MEEDSVKEQWQREVAGLKLNQERIGGGISLSALFFSINSVMNALHATALLRHCGNIT